MISRRGLLAGAAALGGSAALCALDARRPAGASSAREAIEVALRAAERPQSLPCFGGTTLPLWTFSGDGFPAVIRAQVGRPLRVHFVNDLPRQGEHATIHWHGIRLPNAQDGVPYLTQDPVEPGGRFTYEFAPPDAGTFFFHTHCNTAEQIGRGLAGILIVEGDETEPYDAERLIVLRDWSVEGDGFGPFLTAEGAAKAGTFGTIRSCNGEACPRIAVPASADVRLRVLNIDRTRVMQLGIEGGECAVIAVDGIPCTPFPLHGWFTAPAMRFDVVIRTPEGGGEAVLYDYFAPEPVPLARFAAAGEPVRKAAFDPSPLKKTVISEPDLRSAEKVPFVFTATATAAPVAADAAGRDLFLDDLCTSGGSFWAINKRVWPAGDHSRIPPPLAALSLGKSYVFEMRNATPHMHPIHIHGHSFKFLKSNKRELPPHHADTMLLQPKERIEVAFVADNPGDWMFHCHIIEHQETGMMGYVRVA